MRINLDTFEEVRRPMYIVEEAKLRRNLELIASVAARAEVEIILAFKAFALWKTFPIFKEYIRSTTASSLSEAKLAFEEFGSRAHTYSPAYTDDEIGEIASCSSHLTFNSLTQYERYAALAKASNASLSFGLRVNPEYSEVETELYNPCAPGTRFGLSAERLPSRLQADIEGFHCHCHCESGADVFARTLAHIENKFSGWFPALKWINFGGGHLMTRKDYDVERLVRVLQEFKARHPQLQLILEPGSAFAWQTGFLTSRIVDIVEHHGIRTAIVDVSFTCHMPDCLEMPYQPAIRGAKTSGEYRPEAHCYRIGGNSCLSGDFIGYWEFDHPLEIGEQIIFEDMLHYTTVKTTMFNGISHPSISLLRSSGEVELLRTFDYSDYKGRMD